VSVDPRPVPDERMLDTTISAADFLGPEVTGPLPTRARVVVVGAGVVGGSTAAHLAEAGEDDVLLLERHRVASGSSWHAAGLLARVRGTHALTELASYSVETYRTLEARTGLPVAFNPNGSLTLARQPGRVDELLATAAIAHHYGIDAQMLAPDQIPAVHALTSPDGVLAALHQPGDAMVNPGWSAAAMVRWAHDSGVVVREGIRVLGLRVGGSPDAPRITGVVTDQGEVEAERVVLCCGLWTRDLAASVGAVVPLYAAEHVHVTTGSIEGATPDLPLLRDLDASLYIRHNRGALLVGAFEPHGKPRAMSTIGDGFAFGEFEPDWEHFAPVRAAAEKAMPVLRTSTYDRFLCAPESFTPDVNFCLGETPEVAGLFVGAGFNSQGIIYAPGAGRALADWVIEGAPGFDASGVDVARFAAAQGNRRFLHERTRESLGRLYAMHWPHVQSHAARGVRRTPLTDRLAAAGGRLGETNGWERPLWFDRPGDPAEPTYSFRRPSWFGPVAEEHRAAREAVAFFDLSSFATFELAGPDALVVLQHLCTADVDTAIGRVTYTLFLNARGGIELDGTVLRQGDERFTVVVPSYSQRKAWWWLQRACSPRSCTVTDTTSGTAVLHVAGPASLDLLARLTPDDVSDMALRRFTFRAMEVAAADAQVARVSFTGSRGYEIYVGSDYAAGVFEAITTAGADLGLRLAGMQALDSLRSEVGYRHLGHDIGPDDTPVSAGLARFAADGKDFLGKAALSSRGTRRKQVFLALDDPEPTLWHGESVRIDAGPVGFVTSGSYGHTLGTAVGLATLDPEVVAGLSPGSTVPVTVDVLGTAVGGRISLDSFLAPTG
jgi:glycine cleavage system aminomethyltransferase T/glycine/D-amino acid oxidase-like deaminating enzyme